MSGSEGSRVTSVFNTSRASSFTSSGSGVQVDSTHKRLVKGPTVLSQTENVTYRNRLFRGSSAVVYRAMRELDDESGDMLVVVCRK